MKFDRKIKYILYHILFWSSLWVVMVLASQRFPLRVEMTRATMVILNLFLFSFLNYYLLIPRLLRQGRKAAYFVTTLLLMAGWVLLMIHLDKIFIFPMVKDLPVYQEFHADGKYRYAPIIFSQLLMAMMAFFVSGSLYTTREAEQAKATQERMMREKKDVELRLLKSQINPHFLFNALNNIYSLSYMHSPDAPEKILQLSGMLRYVLYDCNDELIDLHKEIDYIQNYIDFQQIKFEQDANVTFDCDIPAEPVLIAPMLLIPLIENAFKFSRLGENPDGWVRLKLRVTKDQIYFVSENSMPAAKPIKATESGGIGLVNIRHRLELSYSGKHQLELNNQENQFQVTLSIQR